MSIYLPLASERIRPVSSASRSVSIRNRLMEKIPTLTPEIASLVAVELTLQSVSSMRKIWQLNPQVLTQIILLSLTLRLLPVSRNKKYYRPCCVFRNGTTRRNARGAISEVLYIDSDSFYTCSI